MENKYSEKKAEDILTDDFFAGELNQKCQSKEQINNDETALAINIAQISGEGSNVLEPNQKDLLGNRVTHTINTYKRRKLIVRFSYAAVFILIVGLSVFFKINKESDIRTFAEQSSSFPLSGNTRLILSGEKEVLRLKRKKTGRDLILSSKFRCSVFFPMSASDLSSKKLCLRSNKM